MTLVGQARTYEHDAAAGARDRAAGITRNLAFVVIGVSALWRALIAFQGYYLLDDFSFIGRAERVDALMFGTLTEPHLGHLMPAAQALVWMNQAIAPWNFGLPAATMAIGWLACLLLMYRLLTAWLGVSPIILIPLTAYALTPLTVQVTTWWAAAINAIPLQLCALGGALLLLPIVRGSAKLSWWRQGVLLLLTCIALAFFTKAILLPVLFMGLAIAWSPGNLRSAVRHALRSAPGLWFSLIAVALGYVIAYRASVPTLPVQTGPAGLVALIERLTQSLVAALLPSVVGGPVRFTPGADPASSAPPWVVGLAIAVLLACVFLVARCTPITRRLALLCVVYALGCIAVISLRTQYFEVPMAGMLRYFADFAVPATLLVASMSRDVLGERPRRKNLDRWIIATVLLAAFGTISVLTTARLMVNPDAGEIRRVALVAQESIEDESSSPILDMWVPYKLLSPLYHGNYAKSSVLFAGLDVAFADQGVALRLWSPEGRLIPARVEGPEARGATSTAANECSRAPGQGTTLSLSAPVIPFTQAIELTTIASRPTSARVSVGGTPAETWELPAGRATMYRWMSAGATTEVRVEPNDPEAAVCVLSVRVGAPVPDERTS